MKEHRFSIETVWTGNLGTGTAGYREYSRDHELSGAGKRIVIPGSSDASFRGDCARYSPEELLVASLSSCHMLWILHLCADAGIIVTAYSDSAEGSMRENADGSGEFVSVTLRPRMSITDAARTDETMALHVKAHQMCFIARSMKFPVKHEPVITASA